MRIPLSKTPWALLALLSVLPVTSCRKTRGPSAAPPPAASVPSELESNALASAASPLLRSQAGSPIHWQPWTAETLKRAEQADRLVFAVILLPQRPEQRQALSRIDADAAMVRTLNTNYVPVLIDGQASREMTRLTAALCAETKRPMQMPLLLWLTHAGNPVAWVPAANEEDFLPLFQQSHDVVSRMWETSREYILRNSAHDQEGRTGRLAQLARVESPTPRPADDCLLAIRQLTTLYDPLSHTFDSVGNVFPSLPIDLLASAAQTPGLDEELKRRAMETSDGLTRDLSASAMIDPLDGGIFSMRRGQAWDLPRPGRDCATQARGATALLQAARKPGNPRLIEQALAALRFADDQYATPDGLFASGLEPPTAPEAWLWKLEDLEAALPNGQARLWTELGDLEKVGNLPFESDLQRRFLRLNSLALKHPLDEAAAKLSLSPEDARREFEASRKTLLAHRGERLGNRNTDRTPQASASFQMVSAFAAAYATTGDAAYRQRASELFRMARERFANGTELQLYANGDPTTEGRAHLYGIAIQAALDLADVTLDPEPAAWAARLAAAAGERFLKDDMLLETPPAQNLTRLPISSRFILFEESSAGLLSAAEARLAKRGTESPAAYAKAVVPLPANALQFPALHSDQLFAALIRHHGVAVTVATDAPAELKNAVACLPLRIVTRATATPGESLPSASARLRFANGAECNVTTASQLFAAIHAGGPPP